MGWLTGRAEAATHAVTSSLLNTQRQYIPSRPRTIERWHRRIERVLCSVVWRRSAGF